MRSRFSWRAGGMAIGLMACGTLEAQVPSPGASFPPPLGAPPPAVSATNSYRTTRKDGLKYLEEELSKSLQFFSGKASLDGVLAPPPLQAPPVQAVIPSRPSKDDADFRTPWSSLDRRGESESDSAADPTGLSGKKRPDQRKMAREEFSDRLNQPRGGVPDPRGTDSIRRNSDKSNSREEDQMPSVMREKERTLREKLFGGDQTERSIYDSGAGGRSVFDLFNPRDEALSREQVQSHQDYLDRYRQVLAVSGPTAGGFQESTKAQSGAVPGQPVGLGGMDAHGSSTRQGNSASSPSDMSSVLRPATLPDLDSKVVNQWNPLYGAPRYEPPKPPPFQAPPLMETPRRRF